MRVARISVLVSLAIAVGLWPSVSQAGQTWQSAQPLSLSATPTILYGQLNSEGQADFYRLNVTRPVTVRLELGQPQAARNFVARIVLYQPDGQTIGPVLPMDQPPHTLALVYPASSFRQTFDVFTQVTYSQTLDTPVRLEQTGTYYLAVYSASTPAGRYRLTLDNGQASIANWSDSWRLPQRWWEDQAFAGWSWQTLFTPTLLLVLAVLVIEQLRYYHLHHLAPAKRRASPSRKSSRSR